MVLKPRLLLWRPELTLTGRSHYGVDAAGRIVSHMDTWDGLANNNYLSVKARRTSWERPLPLPLFSGTLGTCKGRGQNRWKKLGLQPSLKGLAVTKTTFEILKSDLR